MRGRNGWVPLIPIVRQNREGWKGKGLFDDAKWRSLVVRDWVRHVVATGAGMMLEKEEGRSSRRSSMHCSRP